MAVQPVPPAPGVARLRALRHAAWALLLVALLVPSAVLAGTAVRAGDRADREPSALPVAEPLALGSVTTPLLSWRRTPTALVQPVWSRLATEAAAPLVAAVPPGACLVVDVGGQRVVEVEPGASLVPASNQKVLTAIAALAVLPADHRARTTVRAGAPPVGGTVDGDLYLVGGGDRFLSTADGGRVWEGTITPTSLEALADAVVAAGVQRVAGRVLGDDSRYDRTRFLPSWPERYAPSRVVVPLGALMADGEGGYADDPSPAAEAARLLAELLAARGVAVGGAGEGTAPAEAVELAGADGPPLADVVREMLTRSDNTTAELLLRELAVASGQPPTTEAGAQVVATAVGPLLDAAGVPRDDVVVVDGSGLAPGNRLTCRALAALLQVQPSDGPFAAGLAVAGRTGTLAQRFAGSPATDRFRGKTGSIRDVLTLSGFVDDDGGRRWSFAYLVNGPDAEASIDGWRGLVETMAAAPAGPSADAAAPLPPRTP